MALSHSLDKTGHPPNDPLKPIPRLRVAFNRETNFLLSPHYHQQQHVPAEQSSMQQQQQHPHSHEKIENMSTNSTSTSTTLTHYDDDDDDDLNISPKTKTTRFDLKFHDPGLYHAISNFDTETAQARKFARDRQRHRQGISLSDESPRCHRYHQIQQNVGLKVWNGFADSKIHVHHYSNEYDYTKGDGGACGDSSSDRSRKRRRITGTAANTAANTAAASVYDVGDYDMADA